MMYSRGFGVIGLWEARCGFSRVARANGVEALGEMEDGHPVALTGWLEADQAELTVLRRRPNGRPWRSFAPGIR